MLKFAAKAAGYGFIRWETDEDGIDLAVVNHGYWQPLYLNTSTNCDGDALRLAVKLAIDFKIRNGATWWDHLESNGVVYWGHEPHRDDPIAATRRAIVRAAAEIGRNMP